MAQQASLIAELESAISGGSPDQRIETMRRVTDLFLNGADRFTEEQVSVFDDVLGHLIERIESKAVAELSVRLAPIDNAPAEVIRRLANNDDVAVAGPVLSQSARLTSNDLVEIARSKGQQHLLAISGRGKLEESVTDALLDRGDRDIRHSLARNIGARFSQFGYSTLVKSAESDDSLAEQLGARPDIPGPVLQELMVRATEAVRSRLLAKAPSEIRDEVQRVLSTVSSKVGREAAAPRNYEAALRLIDRMQKDGVLNEAAVFEFANARQIEELIVALAALCKAPVDLIAPLLTSERTDGLLIPCKAAELKWPTVQAILKGRFASHAISDTDLAQARTEFLTLSQASANRILRFWQIRAGATADRTAPMAAG